MGIFVDPTVDKFRMDPVQVNDISHRTKIDCGVVLPFGYERGKRVLSSLHTENRKHCLLYSSLRIQFIFIEVHFYAAENRKSVAFYYRRFVPPQIGQRTAAVRIEHISVFITCRGAEKRHQFYVRNGIADGTDDFAFVSQRGNRFYLLDAGNRKIHEQRVVSYIKVD